MTSLIATSNFEDFGVEEAMTKYILKKKYIRKSNSNAKIKCTPLILAHLVNMNREGCEKLSLFNLLFFC